MKDSERASAHYLFFTIRGGNMVNLDVLEKAKQAFWATIVDGHPNVKTGDLPPDLQIQFDHVVEHTAEERVRLNTPEREPVDHGYRDVCFTAGHRWGECHCNNEVPEDEGFEFEGVNIIDPSLSANGIDFVDPVVYYGKAYTDWRDKRERNSL